MRPYFEPIEELERIARNKPHPGIDAHLPRVTDGTLAAVIQEAPKRVIQQEPTGLVTCIDYPEYAEIANLVLTDKLFPSFNRMGNLLQKSWNMAGKSLIYGLQTSYSFLTNTDGEIHTDFVLPYVKDLLLEKGKVYGPDCNILFLRSWYQPRDIEAIIQQEKRLMDKDGKYKSDWDLKLLADLKDGNTSEKNKEYQTPAEREKGVSVGGIEVIHVFQRGKDAEFYSFSPKFENGKVLRTKKNPDPRGNMPIDFLYCNIDLSNPLGRGQVELSGGVQNLIDQQMQMFQFMSTMMMAPPLQVWGNPNKASLKFYPDALWDMGSNPNNKVEPYAVNNAAISNFPNNHQLLQSQIYNLTNSQDHSISATAGNLSQSKTHAGVQAGEARLGISDNYLRKQFESWFGDMCETNLNIFFNQMKGSGSLELSAEQIKKLDEATIKKFVKGNKASIPYKDINDVVFRFTVDASSSEVKEDSDNVDKLTQALELGVKLPDPAIQQAIPKLYRAIIKEIGIEDAEQIMPDPETPGMPGQQPQGPDPQTHQVMSQIVEKLQAMDQQIQQLSAKPQGKNPVETLTYKEAPEDIKRQMEQQAGFTPSSMLSPSGSAQFEQHATALHNSFAPAAPTVEASAPSAPQEAPSDPEEQAFIQQLIQQGFSPEDAQQASVMLNNGMHEDQVLKALTAKRGAMQA